MLGSLFSVRPRQTVKAQAWMIRAPKILLRVSASAKTQLNKDVDQVAAQSSLADPSCEALG